jgi:hypothetical protein
MTQIRVRRQTRRANPSTPPQPLRLPVGSERRGRPPGNPLADELPRRTESEPTGELLQFPRRDPDPPPLAA